MIREEAEISGVADRIRALFATERVAVLSTQKEGRPYASLVAFAATADLCRMVFLTPDHTRKFDNIRATPHVALLVSNARNQAEDVFSAEALTALGTADLPQGRDKADLLTAACAARIHKSLAF